MDSSGYELFAELSRALWWFIALSLAYGLIVTTFLEFWKDVRLRRAFHRRQFERQFRDAAARKELIELAMAGNENALFDLPIERLAQQLSEGAAPQTLQAFQISTASKWKHLLQWWSVTIGLLLGCVPFAVWGDKLDFRVTAVCLAAAVFGGFLAPVLHDILARIRQRS